MNSVFFVDAQAESENGKESILEALSECDAIENMVEVPHYKVEIVKVMERTKEENKKHTIIQSENKISEATLDLDLKSFENNHPTEEECTHIAAPQDEAKSGTSYNQDFYTPDKEVTPPAPRKRRAGPISNTIHMMLCVDTLYSHK